MKKILVILLMSFFINTYAYALTYGSYKEIKNNGNETDKLVINYYLKGLWQGYFWFHINHKFMGGIQEFGKSNPTIFCFPDNGEIKGEVEEFIDAEILYQKQQNKLNDSDSLEILLAQYLNRTFPC